MRIVAAGFLVTLSGLAAACGGQSSRQAETGQSGAAGSSDACASGKDAYHQQRERVLQQLAAQGCQSDSDCGTLWETNACVSTCGVAVPVAGLDGATQELNGVAKDACSTCPAIPVPPCAPPGPLRCVQGQCSDEL